MTRLGPIKLVFKIIQILSPLPNLGLPKYPAPIFADARNKTPCRILDSRALSHHASTSACANSNLSLVSLVSYNINGVPTPWIVGTSIERPISAICQAFEPYIPHIGCKPHNCSVAQSVWTCYHRRGNSRTPRIWSYLGNSL